MIRFRPLLVPTLCFLPALALLIGLGAWQIQRLGWKEALIAQVETGMKAPAEPLEGALARNPASAEWHHVQVSGRFLNDKEIYLFALGPRSAVGVQIVTPLVQADGRIVLVNRGFVPQVLRAPATREAGQLAGPVTLTGVLRLSQKPGLFTPAPDPKTRLWFVKDVPSMAAAMGISVEAPVIIEADATPNPGGWPLGGQTIVDFPNDHLQYAMTWFALALALTGVYLLYHVRQRRLGMPAKGGLALPPEPAP
jgi:surfeit locus 1 family protein